MTKRILLFGALAAALVCGSTGSAEARMTWEEWRRAKAALETLFDAPGQSKAKIALVNDVLGDDQPRAWKALVAAISKTAKSREAAQAEAIEASGGITRGRWDQAVHRKILDALDRASEERALEDELVVALAKGGEGLRSELLAIARRSKGTTMLGIAAAVMARNPDDGRSKPFLKQLLEKHPDPRVRIAVVEALGARPKHWADLLTDALRDAHWSVRVAAASRVIAHGVGTAVPDLIGAISCASPRVQTIYTHALQRLTGQNFEADGGVWRRWWEENQHSFGDANRSAQGPICPSQDHVHFYGLTIRSNRVVFVIDTSGSMNRPVKPGEGAKGRRGLRRIDVAKRELKRSIRLLPPKSQFNIVSFGDRIEAWRPELAVATVGTKTSATRWIEKLDPEGGTSLNGALHAVFGQLGFGDPTAVALAADTVVVLSDGAPTDGWPTGRGAEGRAAVLASARRWNRNGWIILHTVALRGAAVDFLQTLAKENGGECSVH